MSDRPPATCGMIAMTVILLILTVIIWLLSARPVSAQSSLLVTLKYDDCAYTINWDSGMPQTVCLRDWGLTDRCEFAIYDGLMMQPIEFYYWGSVQVMPGTVFPRAGGLPTLQCRRPDLGVVSPEGYWQALPYTITEGQ